MSPGDEILDAELSAAPVGALFAVTDPRSFPGDTNFAVKTADGFLRWVYRDGTLGTRTQTISFGGPPTLSLDSCADRCQRCPGRRAVLHALDVNVTSPAALRAAMRWARPSVRELPARQGKA